MLKPQLPALTSSEKLKSESKKTSSSKDSRKQTKEDTKYLSSSKDLALLTEKNVVSVDDNFNSYGSKMHNFPPHSSPKRAITASQDPSQGKSSNLSCHQIIADNSKNVLSSLPSSSLTSAILAELDIGTDSNVVTSTTYRCPERQRGFNSSKESGDSADGGYLRKSGSRDAIDKKHTKAHPDDRFAASHTSHRIKRDSFNEDSHAYAHREKKNKDFQFPTVLDTLGGYKIDELLCSLHEIYYSINILL